MKQVTLSFFAISLILLASCSKEKVSSPNPSIPPPSIQNVQIVSDWISMNFSQGGPENPDQFEAVHYFAPTVYDEQGHTKLAFVRTSNGHSALPANIVTDGEPFRLSFFLTLSSFEVIANHVYDPDYAGGVSLSDCQFRYIIVSNSVFTSTQINWANYSEVASALGITD